jgi:hypothetical protein
MGTEKIMEDMMRRLNIYILKGFLKEICYWTRYLKCLVLIKDKNLRIWRSNKSQA